MIYRNHGEFVLKKTKSNHSITFSNLMHLGIQMWRWRSAEAQIERQSVEDLIDFKYGMIIFARLAGLSILQLYLDFF